MDMGDVVRVGSDTIIPGRPFTDPDHSTGDLRTMQGMARQLVALYNDPVVCDFAPGKRPVCQSDPRGWHFRIYYVNPALLFSRRDLAVVGFFGHRRPGADIAPLVAADRRFEAQFHRHDALLSLSTVRLPDGDFANLVVFTDPAAIDTWNHSQPHHDLVRRIAPPYYQYVRLNNATLPGGAAGPATMRLLRVKYIDYDPVPPWRGVRVFEE